MLEVEARNLEFVEPFVDLKIKITDGMLLLVIGLLYGGVLVGLFYSLLGEGFSRGLLHGFLLGMYIGLLSYIVIYFNNQNVLPKIKQVLLWWVVWGILSFVVGLFGFLLAFKTLLLFKVKVPVFLTQKEKFLIASLSTGILTYLTGLMIYQFVRMRNRKEAIERITLEANYKLTLRMLNAHFLSNSLHTLLELMDMNKEVLECYVKHLVNYQRRALTSPKIIPLKEEISMVNSYVFIEKIRKGRDIVFTTDVDENLENEPIPALILQPIIENAIQHGLPEDKSKHFEISISAKRNGQYIILCVLNNGNPISNFQPGIGLSLLAKKLESQGGKLILKSKNPPCFMVKLPILSIKGYKIAYESSNSR
uniref:Signal transduction histidine kinase internal region domain-containing protein n=1 Tax=Thermodesulfobacterium geofontis TaxID=1295609 RepID=A0A7C4JQJ2_9BACT